MPSGAPVPVDRSFTFNRAARVTRYVVDYMRYQLGLRGRPNRPPEVSDRAIKAARELASALLEERP